MAERVKPTRKRPRIKSVCFTDDEWTTIAARMSDAGVESFSSFARDMLLAGEVRVNHAAIEAAKVETLLGPIGVNINQIARRVNADDEAQAEQLDAVRKMLARIYAVLIESAGGGDPWRR